MSLLDELQFHSNEEYVDIRDEDNLVSMAVFGLGRASLMSAVRVEVQEALTPSVSQPAA